MQLEFNGRKPHIVLTVVTSFKCSHCKSQSRGNGNDAMQQTGPQASTQGTDSTKIYNVAQRLNGVVVSG